MEDIVKSVGQVRAGVEPCIAAWQHWRVFREGYVTQLSPTAVLAGRAFVEAACERAAITQLLHDQFPDCQIRRLELAVDRPRSPRNSGPSDAKSATLIERVNPKFKPIWDRFSPKDQSALTRYYLPQKSVTLQASEVDLA